MKKTPALALSILCVALWSCASTTTDTDAATSDVPMISSSNQSAITNDNTIAVDTADVTPETEQTFVGTPGHTGMDHDNSAPTRTNGTGTASNPFDHPNAMAAHADSSNASMTSASSLDTDEDDDDDTTAAAGTRTRLRKH